MFLSFLLTCHLHGLYLYSIRILKDDVYCVVTCRYRVTVQCMHSYRLLHRCQTITMGYANRFLDGLYNIIALFHYHHLEQGAYHFAVYKDQSVFRRDGHRSLVRHCAQCCAVYSRRDIKTLAMLTRPLSVCRIIDAQLRSLLIRPSPPRNADALRIVLLFDSLFLPLSRRTRNAGNHVPLI